MLPIKYKVDVRMMPPCKVAIVILNWNGAKLLQQFLPNVLRNSNQDGIEVIVVDNASTDNSLDVLKHEFSEVRTIVLDSNYGFAGGYNEALKQVEAEYFLLLNSDVEVSYGWLNPLINAIEADKEVAAIMPKIISYKEKTNFEYAGASGGFIDKYGYPYCRGRMFDVVEKDRGEYNTLSEVFWVTGCCMLIRSSVFNEVGGFDSDFFAHQEEIDLCWRMKNRGYKLLCQPESVVFHVGGASLAVGNPRKTYLNFRNNLLLLYKNLPQKNLNRTIFIRYILDGVAGVKFLFVDGWRHMWAVVRAHRDFRKMKRKFKAKRIENLNKMVVENHVEMFDGLILIEYYLKGKTTFSALHKHK